MKLVSRFLLPVLFLSFLLAGCEKELSYESFEQGNVVGEGTAVGVFSGAPGSCANLQVIGLAGVGIALTDSNRIQVEINFSVVGSYFISTDTVSGMYFSKAGFATATGPQNVVLTGHGVPLVEGFVPFKVKFKGSECTFDLQVYPVAIATNADYFPTTPNSFWKYRSSDPLATSADTLRSVSTNLTATNTATGDTYNVFTAAYTPTIIDTQYYRKGSGLYHQFSSIDFAGVASNNVFDDFTFLKDNVPVASTWESDALAATVGGASVSMKLSFQIMQKDVNLILNNMLYRNVIKVRTVQLTGVGTAFTPVISFESWYARGIGLINVVVAAPVYGYFVTQYKVF